MLRTSSIFAIAPFLCSHFSSGVTYKGIVYHFYYGY